MKKAESTIFSIKKTGRFDSVRRAEPDGGGIGETSPVNKTEKRELATANSLFSGRDDRIRTDDLFNVTEAL